MAYAAIEKAATMMARSNGGINCARPEKDFLDALALVLMHAPHDLNAIDDWLATKSDDELLTIVDGEEEEMLRACVEAPPGTYMLLDDIFAEAV